MDQFTVAYFIAVGLFVLAIWALLVVDIVGPGLVKVLARVVARTRDRKVRRAWHLWYHARIRVAIHRWHTEHIHP